MSDQHKDKPQLLLTDDGELVLPKKKKKAIGRNTARLILSVLIMIVFGILVGVVVERNMTSSTNSSKQFVFNPRTSTAQPTMFPEGTLSPEQIRMIATAHGTDKNTFGINDSRVSKSVVLPGDSLFYEFHGLSGVIIGAVRRIEMGDNGTVSTCVAFIVHGPLRNEYKMKMFDGYWIENWSRVTPEDAETLFQTAIDYVKAHCDLPVKIMRLN